MDARQLLAELRARGVYRVAALYSAGAWALLQVADLFFPLLGLPDWSITALLAVAAAGFPFAIILAWWFDITPEGIVEAPPPVTPPQRYRLTPVRLAEFALIITLIVLVGFLYMERLGSQGRQSAAAERHSRGGSEKQQRASIAVLPFANMSESKDTEYFGDGLAEEILNLLAKLNEMNVASRTSSFYFKNKDADIEQIGKHLGVDHVLEGSIRKQGERIRVTAQLIDVNSGFHLWSETYDRDFKNVFSIQDDIAKQVVENLQLILSSASMQTLERRSTLDPVAYDYYLQGRDYLRRPIDPEILDRAIGLFEKSVALDAGYAEAYAGLCDSYLAHYSRSRDVIHFEKAENACQRALSLDDRAIAVHVALGNLYRHSGLYGLAEQEFNTALALNPMAVDAYSGLAETQLLDNRPEVAEKTFLQAIELQPNNWRGYKGMGNFLFETGRIDEAIPYYQRITELMPDNELAFNNLGAAYYLSSQFEPATEAWQKSLQLNPTVVVYSNLGSSLYFLGRFEEATQMYQKAVELAPEDFESWGNLGDSYRFADGLQEYAAPMYRNAIKLAMELLKINPSAAETMSLVAHYQANIGEREQALQYMARATALAPQNWTVQYNATTALVALGELEQAFVALKKALDLGYSPQLVQVDKSLEQLRKLPQFQEITQLSD